MSKLFVSKLFFFMMVVALVLQNEAFTQERLTKYVDPLIGTGGHGHTFPGATLPNGMVQLSPDTDIHGWDWCSGYHYSDNSIMGFSHTHLSGTGCTDYGDILLMPTTGALRLDPGTKDNPDSGYRSRFNHENEIAKPGYYSVNLGDYNINVELTATKRAGFHKYTFPKNESSHVIIDLVHGIEDKVTDAMVEIIDNKTIQGYRRSFGWGKDHTVFFYAEFSKPFDSYGVVEDKIIRDQKKDLKAEKVKAFFNYTTYEDEAILVKVGISHTNLEEAKNNLVTEIPNWNFEEIRELAGSQWEKELSKIIVESKSQKEKTIFYTALYHTLLQPNTFTDASGSYKGMDGKNRKNADGEIFTTFSLWDTFRAAHPLYTIIDKEKANGMVKTLIHKYEESGLLPVWELAANETGQMIGYHSIPVIYDAFSKGIRDYDVEKAYEAMKNSAMQDHHGLEYYKSMGFIPSDLENESVSKTLEYAYDDWCVAMMAKDLGKEDDYKYFIERAKFYLNVYDPSIQLMRPKKNGRWFEPFDPYSVSGHYTEANAWQYSFFVPQDINSLIELMGGDDHFNLKLDELFTTNPNVTGKFQPDISGLIGQYAHGNEPSHHMAYLYNYSGQPWKTQEKIHEIVKTLYTDKPDGISGNEDCGQMSAWYILSAAGFYPVCPGSNQYVIGTPLFESVTFSTGEGKLFTIEAKNLSEENYYIQSAELNGADYTDSFLKHSEIVNGGKLVLVMGNKPSKWGHDTSSRPKSFIDEDFVSVPYLKSGERVFRDSSIIEIKSVDSEYKIYFTLDGSDPRENKKLYTDPIIIKETSTIKSVCEKGSKFSQVVTSEFNKIPKGRTIELNTKYHHSYTGGGALGLIDGIKGSTNFHTDAWQGYEGENLQAVIDLGEIREVHSIDVSFLQATGSWIFLPARIEFYTSEDGVNFLKMYETENKLDADSVVEGISDYKKDFCGIKTKYVKIFAENIGVCPSWHIAAGGKAWLFVDEISIK